MKIFIMIGLLAAFFPYSGKDKDPKVKQDRRKEKRAYLILSLAGLGLGIMEQFGLYPGIAKWIDQVMELLFRSTGSVEI